MKHTRNMVFEETEEARELTLYITNNGALYPWVRNIIANLAKKAKKGVYDPERAVDLYYPLATEGSHRYKTAFGYEFSVKDRFSAAVMLEEYYREDVEE